MDNLLKGDFQDNAIHLFTTYYEEELAELAQGYPKDKQSLWVEFSDLYQVDSDMALDFLAAPDKIQPIINESLNLVDLPVDVDLSDAQVRVYDLPSEYTYAPGEIRKEQANRYVTIRGTLERVTTTSDMPNMVAWDCGQCETTTMVEQDPSKEGLQEPGVCDGCDRQGPFTIVEKKSEWSDYAKLRVEARPDVNSDSDGKITGYVLDDLIDVGAEEGIIGRAGEPVKVSGIVKRSQKTGRGENELLFDHVLEVHAIEFERDDETVDVEAHKDEFTQLAQQPDAIDKFAESIAPNLHATDAWDAAFEFAVAYLFGAPRVDLDDGPTYRGDLHFLIITDYGMGKSTFKEDIEAYSPKCISKSTTALSSGVGLTAAAVKDDFGEGQWTLKPGLLVRANGGHLLLDEIDKGPDELTDMNDALEGEQLVDIEKAGMSATYESRTGLMALGNPIDGRFDPNASVSSELGISETLLSRFDGIVTMSDQADIEQDENIAETYGKSYTEAQEKQYGDREEFNVLDREVPVDVGQAWIKYARENVNPILRYEQFEELEEWYAKEVRQLNKKYATEGDGENMPVPATVRELGAAVKMSIAFARVHLCEEVQAEHVERAKKLGKRLVKQKWNGEQFNAVKDQSPPDTQKKQYRAIMNCIQDEQKTPKEIAEETGLGIGTVKTKLDDLHQQRDVHEPIQGEYRAM